jgi:hypothetical protein
MSEHACSFANSDDDRSSEGRDEREDEHEEGLRPERSTLKGAYG